MVSLASFSYTVTDVTVQTWMEMPMPIFFLIGIHTMQGWTATTRHGVTRKEAQKDYSIQEICLERTCS